MTQIGIFDPESIPKLVKELDKIARHRSHELERLTKVLGQNPRVLASRYVEPSVQFKNPADVAGRRAALRHGAGQSFQLWVSRFLGTEDVDSQGDHVLFVLGDAGMGKTSALVMLKLCHMFKFLPSRWKVQLEKLGPGTLKEIDQIEAPSKTILLLDALDEDPEAHGRVEERLLELLRATKPFHKVIITCRTQFFPAGGSHSMISEREVEVGGFVCNLLYLSPFWDDQVDEYLAKAFPPPGPRWARGWLKGFEPPRRKAARALIKPMRDLRMRPLLLSYIDRLLEDPALRDPSRPPGLYRVFDALILRWLLREERKLGDQNPAAHPKAEDLRKVCRRLAFRLMQVDRPALTTEDLRSFLDDTELGHLKVIDIEGRSLLNKTSEQEFRFAHRTVQEFLAIEYLTEQVRAGQAVEAVPATDEMIRFYLSAVRADPTFPDLTPYLDAQQIEQPADLIWPEGESADLPSTRWQFPNLSFRNLQGRDFSGQDLRGACFAGVNLTDVDLTHTDLTDADFRGARLERVKWTGAVASSIPLDRLHTAVTVFRGEIPLWCEIPAGEGQIGGNEVAPGPRRIRVARPFQLAAVPVTNAQFALFDREKADPKRPNHPVVNVSWEDAARFCAWLAKLPGFEGARLPTEEEWEYACRAGTDTPYWSGTTESDLARVGWYSGNSGKRLHAVGESSANPWGLYDMHGNVWEWTASVGQDDESASETEMKVDPAELAADLAASPRAGRVFRGGSYLNSARGARSAYRFGWVPGDRVRDLGFRVLLPFAPSDP